VRQLDPGGRAGVVVLKIGSKQILGDGPLLPRRESPETALTAGGPAADSVKAMDSRTERVVLETDRHRIVGDLNLPRDGYLSRLSDYLNRGDLVFIPLVNATIAPLGADRPSEQRSFIAIARVHVHLAYPAGEAAEGP
jgi:hypothetical protein